MWPFKKKPKNVMKRISIEITSDGGKYKIYIWDLRDRFAPKIIASKHNIDSYSQAADEGIALWNEVKEARIKLYGE